MTLYKKIEMLDEIKLESMADFAKLSFFLRGSCGILKTKRGFMMTQMFFNRLGGFDYVER